MTAPLNGRLVHHTELTKREPIRYSRANYSRHRNRDYPLRKFRIRGLSRKVGLSGTLRGVDSRDRELRSLLSAGPGPRPGGHRLKCPVSRKRRTLFCSRRRTLFYSGRRENGFFAVYLYRDPRGLARRFGLLGNGIGRSSESPFDVNLVRVNTIRSEVGLTVGGEKSFTESVRSLLARERLFEAGTTLLPGRLLHVVANCLVSDCGTRGWQAAHLGRGRRGSFGMLVGRCFVGSLSGGTLLITLSLKVPLTRTSSASSSPDGFGGMIELWSTRFNLS